ncbi:hypothetical protein [Clostridium sp. UBA1056]|uniref:hypothetical protein n=1 Tax=unclassified Clostridium TaxID=2614128 RepID=UPI0032168EB9
MLESYKYARKENVTVYYVGNDSRFVIEVMEGLLYSYKELEKYFQLKDRKFSIRAILAMNRREYDYIGETVLKLKRNSASKRSEVTITSKNDLLILSPFAYGEESTYDYEGEMLQKLIYSQVVHIFNEFLSLNPEASSTWFGQGIAIYLSKLWDEENINKEIKKAMKEEMIPSLKMIQENKSLYKTWAWTIIRYIEEIYGKEIINEIIRKYDESDIFSVIKVPIDDFEDQWRAWLENEDNIS